MIDAGGSVEYLLISVELITPYVISKSTTPHQKNEQGAAIESQDF